MKTNLDVVTIDRRRLLTTLAGGGAALITGAANVASERVRFTSPGDSVIVTNAGLVATDPGLPRIGELAWRLDYALRHRKVLDHISRSKSRCFALSSVTLNGSLEPLLHDYQTTLDRQSEFVSRTFGPLAIDDLPAYVATSIDEDDRELLWPVLDVFAYITSNSGFAAAAETFCPSDVFYRVDAPCSKLGTLDLIALWPVKWEA